jgi:hypothetical protein
MGFLDNSENKKINKKITSKDISKKYSVIISFSENTKIKVNLVSNQKDGSRFFIKNDIAFFSSAQKLILKDVRENDG